MRHHLLLFAALSCAAPAFASPGDSGVAAPFVASTDPAEFDQSLECLTQAVYYEARNQSDDGQRAVAQVVLNRVRHPAYPNSICGVVFQGSERVTGCQFSFTCDGSMNRGIEYYAWQNAQSIAREALSGRIYRLVGLALNYHTTAIRPYWAPSLVRQAVVGSHIFYRRPGTTEGSFIQAPGEEVAPDLTAAPRTVAVHSAPGREGRAQRVRYERVIMEIPVVERPVRFRTVGAQRTTANRPASTRRAAATRRGARISVESGVRVARGS